MATQLNDLATSSGPNAGLGNQRAIQGTKMKIGVGIPISLWDYSPNFFASLGLDGKSCHG
jgi:hypothetical protein